VSKASKGSLGPGGSSASVPVMDDQMLQQIEKLKEVRSDGPG
jgi:hypothetical protein